MRPPTGVNFMALEMKLTSTCSILPRSENRPWPWGRGSMRRARLTDRSAQGVGLSRLSVQLLLGALALDGAAQHGADLGHGAQPRLVRLGWLKAEEFEDRRRVRGDQHWEGEGGADAQTDGAGFPGEIV